MVSSVPPEVPFVVVVAADEEGLLFPPLALEDALVVDSPEVVALSVLWDSLPAEVPPTPAPPQLASTTTSTSVRAPTANVPSSGPFIVLSLIPLGWWGRHG